MAAKKKNGNGHKTPTQKNALDAIFEAVADLKHSFSDLQESVADLRGEVLALKHSVNANLLRLHRRLRKIENLIGLEE